MKKFSAFGLRAACVLVFALLGGCDKAPTDPSAQSGSELNKAATPLATPSPEPSPTARPNPSPTASPSPSPGPAIPFDVFFIKEARVEWQRDPGDQRLEVEGLFVLAGAGAGNKLPDSAVTIVFGNFRVVIPGGSFVRNDDNDGFKFENKNAGIKEIEIKDDGSFEIDARDLNLTSTNFMQPVLFALQIGNARGQFKIPFDRDGRFENPNPLPSPAPTVSPSPAPSPTVSPNPSPSPTTSPSPSPSPELHLEGPIQAIVVRGSNNGDVTVQGVKFIVTSSTRLEDENGNSITLNAFALGEVVDAWGPPAVNGATQATRIRKE